MSWNFASLVSAIGQSSLAHGAALIHGSQSISYSQLDQRSDAIGSYFTSLGLNPGSHIGHLMRNSNAYIETFIGCGKSVMTHVNINYRYQAEELAVLCESLDTEAIKSFAKQHLADYKVPRLIFPIDSLQRAANGKSNYPLITQYAQQQQKT